MISYDDDQTVSFSLNGSLPDAIYKLLSIDTFCYRDFWFNFSFEMLVKMNQKI